MTVLLTIGQVAMAQWMGMLREMVKINTDGQLVLPLHYFNRQCAFQILVGPWHLYQKSAGVLAIQDLVLLGIAQHVPQAPEFVESSLRAQPARLRALR